MGTPSTNVVASFPAKSVWVTSGTYDQFPQTLPGSLQQISRVQETTIGLTYPLADNTYLDSSVESYNLHAPGANVDIRLLNTNGRPEWYLGLAKLTPSGELILGLDQEKDLYLAAQNSPGVDAVGAPASASQTVLGLGQAVITSYELAAQVGGMIESRISMNALTAVVYNGIPSGLTVPSVQYQDGSTRTGQFIIPAAQSLYDPSVSGSSTFIDDVTAISARDMVMMFPVNSPFAVVYTGQQAVYLQSFNLGLTVNRQEQKPLGYAYPTARQIIYPIQVDLTTQALVSRMQADRLDRLDCTTTGFAAYLAVKQPCSNASVFGFYFDDLQVDSQQFSNSIGPIDTVTTKWRGWIKTPQDAVFTPFIQYIVNAATTGAWGLTW